MKQEKLGCKVTGRFPPDYKLRMKICVRKRRTIADKYMCHLFFFFFAHLHFSVFQIFFSKHIPIFSKNKKASNAHFKKDAVSGCGGSSRGPCPPALARPKAMGPSSFPEGPSSWVSASLRGSSPILSQREVSGCGFLVPEPQKWKETSLRYRKGRPEQMLF